MKFILKENQKDGDVAVISKADEYDYECEICEVDKGVLCIGGDNFEDVYLCSNCIRSIAKAIEPKKK